VHIVVPQTVRHAEQTAHCHHVKYTWYPDEWAVCAHWSHVIALVHAEQSAPVEHGSVVPDPVLPLGPDDEPDEQLHVPSVPSDAQVCAPMLPSLHAHERLAPGVHPPPLLPQPAAHAVRTTTASVTASEPTARRALEDAMFMGNLPQAC
jgi:hypothetical protein